MSLYYHIDSVEGHIYWYDASEETRSSWEAHHVSVEVPAELVAPYQAAQKLVIQLGVLLEPYVNQVCYEGHLCPECGSPPLMHSKVLVPRSRYS